MVAHSWGAEGKCGTVNGHDGFFWNAENVLILIMMTAAQFCDYTKTKH